MKRIIVLASGNGTNFEAITRYSKKKKTFSVDYLIYNREDAFVRQRAEKLGIKNIMLKKDSEICNFLLDKKPDLIVLAGYMKLLKDKRYFTEFKNKILNIHPSLLPCFKGLEAQKQAFDFGVKISGCTIHYVDETLDGGKIIWQEAVFIGDCKTEDEVVKKIRKRELYAYPRVIEKVLQGEKNIIRLDP